MLAFKRVVSFYITKHIYNCVEKYKNSKKHYKSFAFLWNINQQIKMLTINQIVQVLNFFRWLLLHFDSTKIETQD